MYNSQPNEELMSECWREDFEHFCLELRLNRLSSETANGLAEVANPNFTQWIMSQLVDPEDRATVCASTNYCN